MARSSHSRSRSRAAAALAGVAALLLLPASALGAAAVDEYSLGPAGGENEVSSQAPAQLGEKPGAVPPQLGVVGENEPAQSPLDAAGVVVWLGLGLLLAVGLLAAARARSPRSAA